MNPRRKGNLPLLGLALLLSTILWSFVATGNSTQKSFEIRLKRSVPEGYVFTGDLPETIRLTVEGPKMAIVNLNESDFSVTLPEEIETPPVGRRFFDITAEDVRSPANISIIEIQPSEIFYHVEREVRRRVPVRVNQAGNVTAGYEIPESKGIVCRPPRVEIMGPKSEMDKVDRVETESIQLTGRESSFSISVGVGIPPDVTTGVRITDPPSREVAVDVEIREMEKTRTFEQLPVTLVSTSFDAQCNPAVLSYTMTGPSSRIDALRPEMLRVTVDVGERDPGDDYRIEPKVSFDPPEAGNRITATPSQSFVDVVVRNRSRQ